MKFEYLINILLIFFIYLSFFCRIHLILFNEMFNENQKKSEIDFGIKKNLNYYKTVDVNFYKNVQRRIVETKRKICARTNGDSHVEHV